MSARGGRRVLITGIGLLTPLGLDRESTWAALTEGRSGIGPVTLFPVFVKDLPDFLISLV